MKIVPETCNKISQCAINKKPGPKPLCRVDENKQRISGVSSTCLREQTLNCAPQNQKLRKTAKSKL